MPDKALFALACAAVVLASFVKSAGFDFSIANMSDGVNLELSRVLYGIGLVVAGCIADRSRLAGLALCAASLVAPFLTSSLMGFGVSAMALWSLEYLFFGFFTVFRVTVAADLAAQAATPWRSGLGMAFGRLGDAAGTLLCICMQAMPLVHTIATTAAFALTAAIMLVLGTHLYPRFSPGGPTGPEVRDPFGEFCVEHGLSAREREVLLLLLDGKTNAEISAELFVTERTIKYHVHNILEKTACKNRLDVVDLYITSTKHM